MTATERLRQLLDERGVEWGKLVDSYGIIGTFWWDSNNDQCSALEGADDIPIGKLSVQANLTPEQAIAATLGAGTCEDELREALADLWPRASFTMCPENRVSWLERLAELGVEVES